MPAKIDPRLVYEALYDTMRREGQNQKRLTIRDFTKIVKGASIASSKSAIETLWYQLQFSEANVYTGKSDLVIADLGRLSDLVYPGAHTYTHTHIHTHTEVTH